jgi:hypothetical protein
MLTFSLLIDRQSVPLLVFVCISRSVIEVGTRTVEQFRFSILPIHETASWHLLENYQVEHNDPNERLISCVVTRCVARLIDYSKKENHNHLSEISLLLRRVRDDYHWLLLFRLSERPYYK